jgi:hypothetical protein
MTLTVAVTDMIRFNGLSVLPRCGAKMYVRFSQVTVLDETTQVKIVHVGIIHWLL